MTFTPAPPPLWAALVQRGSTEGDFSAKVITRKVRGISLRPTLGRVRKDSVAPALDDGRSGGVLDVVGGAGGFGGGVLRGGLGGGVPGHVGTPVVVPLALLLQGEPSRDVVQLGRIGQIYENLRDREELTKHNNLC